MEGNTYLLQVIRKMRAQINRLERENRALKGELRGCGHTAARGDGSAGERGREPGLGAERPAASPASPAFPASPESPAFPASPESPASPATLASPASLAFPASPASSASPASPASHATPATLASPASLRGGAAAAPAPREQTGTAMTVRRYPSTSPAPAPSSTRCHWAGRNPASTGLLEVPGSAQPPAPPAAAQLSREQEKGLEKSPASCLSCSHSSNLQLFQEHVYKCQGKVKAVSFLLPTDISSFAEKQGSLRSPQNQSTKHLMTITERDM